jgi:hypothetical protein
MPPPDSFENPFHVRGHITQKDAAAWRAMKWHDSLLIALLQDLEREPPPYTLVRGPAMSGKTTFAMQFRARVAADHPEIFAVYVPLGATITSLSHLLHQIHQAFVERVGELLDSAVVQDATLVLSEALTHWGTIDLDDLHVTLRELIQWLPEQYRRVVLILDDFDRMPDEIRLTAAETLRTIFADRSSGPLKGFSLLLLGQSLMRGPQAVSPLANVVKTYRLGDFSRDDFKAFISRSGEALGGVVIQENAADYLYRKANGQIVMLQRLLKTATAGRQGAIEVEISDAYRSVVDCFEPGGGIVDHMVDVGALAEEAQRALDAVLRGTPLPCWESEPGIAELIDLGLVIPGPTHLCICRSPLIRELLVTRYRLELESFDLSQKEYTVANIPPVAVAVVTESLLHGVESRLAAIAKDMLIPGGDLLAEAVGVLIASDCALDLDEVQFYYDRYFGELFPAKIGLDDIFRAIAKILLAWSKENA